MQSGKNEAANAKYTKQKRYGNYFKRYWQLYALMALPVAYYIIFKYIPMFGNILAFRRHRPGLSPFGTDWVGFRYFKMFLRDASFWRAFRNTVTLSVSNLAVNFPIPIIFALLLNELRNHQFKKLLQTVSYVPRFFATVVVISMVTELLSPNSGIVNQIIRHFGGEQIFFFNEPMFFRPIYILTDTWQFTGYSSIIYLAAIVGINEEMYEAAMIDGANRWKQTIHVTLPSIMSTIMVMFILRVGQLMSLGFEKVLLMYTTQNSSVSDIIDTFVYRVGLQQTNYSYATAVGLFGGVIGLVLVTTVNRISRAASGESLY